MNEDRLDAALQDLAAAVEFPAPPELRARVRTRIEALPARVPWWRRLVPEGVPGLAFGAALAVVLACAFLVSSPGARQAVADFLGLEGVRVEFRERVPSPTPRVTGDDLRGVFGVRVGPDEARDHVSFPLPVPRAVEGIPDYYVGEGITGDAVTLAYPATAALPPIQDTDYGVIVSALRDFPPEQYFGKLLGGPGALIDEVEVAGVTGYWTEATEHALNFDGQVRRSGNALLWQTPDGITYRVETSLPLNAALEIAESIRR